MFICRRLSNSTINVGRYINPFRHEEPSPAGDEEGGQFIAEKQDFNNGLVLCQFTLSNFENNYHQHLLDIPKLSQSKLYYPIIAIGQLDSDGIVEKVFVFVCGDVSLGKYSRILDEIMKHSDDSVKAQTYQVQLNIPQVVSFRAPTTSENLDYLKAHGIIMTVVWVLLASTGVFLARYFKSTWAKHSLCGERVWFALHRLSMSLTTVLTLLGFIFIFKHKKGTWVDDDQSSKHAILGAIVTVLSFIQPFTALFRCHVDGRYRFIFNYFHAFLGTIAFSLSTATILLATYYFTDIFTTKISQSLMIAWIAWVIVLIIVFESVERKLGESNLNFNHLHANGTSSDFKSGKFSIKYFHPAESSTHTSNTFKGRIKVFLLILHICISLSISIILIIPIIRL